MTKFAYVLWITLITGESGPVELPEAMCFEIEREFQISSAMHLPVTVDRDDGTTQIVTSMQCLPDETSSSKGAGS